mmetsp:Transcript_23754/g.65916  ORF Transcript_23754/g.65916 Transcript_23754/m.65916 type:complete len:301 (+) Transcript_23754:1-903(+)
MLPRPPPTSLPADVIATRVEMRPLQQAVCEFKLLQFCGKGSHATDTTKQTTMASQGMCATGRPPSGLLHRTMLSMGREKLWAGLLESAGLCKGGAECGPRLLIQGADGLGQSGRHPHPVRQPLKEITALAGDSVQGLDLHPRQVGTFTLLEPRQLLSPVDTLQHQRGGVGGVEDSVAFVDSPFKPIHEEDPQGEPVADDDNARVAVVPAGRQVAHQLVLKHLQPLAHVGARLPVGEAVEEAAVAEPLGLVLPQLLVVLEVPKVLLAELHLLPDRYYLSGWECLEDAFHGLNTSPVRRAVH